MTFTEHLAALASLFEAEDARADLAEAKAQAATAELATARERIAFLEAQLEALTPPVPEPTPEPPPEPVPEPPPPEPVPPPSGVFVLKDDFTEAPSDSRYIRACHDPAKNFILASPGNLRCIFEAGHVGGPYANGPDNEVLRSELILRKPGTDDHWRASIGKEYVFDYAFTLTPNWKPYRPNQPTLLKQHWQTQDVKPPVQIQAIDPETTPDPLILRLVLTAPAAGDIPAVKELRAWKMPIERGKRYDLRFHVFWSFTKAGFMRLQVNGTQVYTRTGPTCFDREYGLAPHWGQYQPGSAEYPPGSTTEILIHRNWISQP